MAHTAARSAGQHEQQARDGEPTGDEQALPTRGEKRHDFGESDAAGEEGFERRLARPPQVQ
jgi:hypothetical protein